MPSLIQLFANKFKIHVSFWKVFDNKQTMEINLILFLGKYMF